MDPIKDLMETMELYITAKVNEIVGASEHEEFRRKVTNSARANLELSLRYAIAKRSSSTQITAIRIEKDPDEEEEES
jgi:hypothetical protein